MRCYSGTTIHPYNAALQARPGCEHVEWQLTWPVTNRKSASAALHEQAATFCQYLPNHEGNRNIIKREKETQHDEQPLTFSSALRAESLSLANDLQEEGITVISMDPGWVKTDMGGPMADIEAPESIAGQIKVYDTLKLKDTGALHGKLGCQNFAVHPVTSSVACCTGLQLVCACSASSFPAGSEASGSSARLTMELHRFLEAYMAVVALAC